MAVHLTPIGDPDLDEVAAFLHRTFEPQKPAASWRQAIACPWPSNSPNRGFMLRDEGEIVGVYVAYYSEQEVRGETRSFCDLGTWCVDDDHRMHSVRLLKELVGQEGYEFTDLSPRRRVARLNDRLGFRPIDPEPPFLVGATPWPVPSPGVEVTTERSRIEAILHGRDLRIYRDHIGARAAIQIVIRRGARHCHVVARRGERRGHPILELLHVSDPETFHRGRRAFGWHVLVRHRCLAYLAERRQLGYRPRISIEVRFPQMRMFLSDRVQSSELTYLYSELACMAA